MKIGKKVTNRTMVITLSMACAILTAMNCAAQDQQDPFKKGQQPAASTAVKPSAGALDTAQARIRLEEKMQKIMIPKVEFVDAKIEDVVNYLHQQSVEGDKDSAPGEKGVNIILRLSQPGQPAAGGVPLITMTLRDVSLMDAIKYITDIAGLKYRVEENVVVIHSPNIVWALETRTYKVMPSTIEAMIGTADLTKTATADKPGTTDRTDIKKFLNEAGIPFQENTSIFYIPSASTLIVKNTRENLEQLELLLKKFHVGPLLVSVDMRMIEMPRLAAEDLFKEQGGLAKTGVIKEKTLGAITELVLKGSAKVVSQSKLITKNGSNCQNKSVREFTYPTEYSAPYYYSECESNATNSAQALPAGSSNAINGVKSLPGTLIPAAFATRDLGTILDFTPTVGPDMQTIDICLLPQRVRLSANPNKVKINTPAGKIEVEQPVFITEGVTTQLSIQDGQTMLISVSDAISDQDKQDKANENIILVILTANLLCDWYPIGTQR